MQDLSWKSFDFSRDHLHLWNFYPLPWYQKIRLPTPLSVKLAWKIRKQNKNPKSSKMRDWFQHLSNKISLKHRYWRELCFKKDPRMSALEMSTNYTAYFVPKSCYSFISLLWLEKVKFQQSSKEFRSVFPKQTVNRKATTALCSEVHQTTVPVLIPKNASKIFPPIANTVIKFMFSSSLTSV